MKITYLSIIFFLFNLNLSANSLYCEFEEVYQNGDYHQGFLLLKNDNLRYEYLDEDLYTILFLNQKLIIVENLDRSRWQYVEKHDQIIPFLIEIYRKYPNIEKQFQKSNFNFLVESNHKNFIKRVKITSQKLNMNIYFNQCDYRDIEKKYLNFNPLINYVPNKS